MYSSTKKATSSLNQSLESDSPDSRPKKVVAVGDIACDPSDKNFSGGSKSYCQASATYGLVKKLKPDAILALGDLQYEDGSLDKFMQSYDKNWGQIKHSIYPVAGNHEYLTSGAEGYFNYFNEGQSSGRAGEVGKGYYSADIGIWHIIALNSNCAEVGGCGENSPQLNWLEQDLSSSKHACILAFWHHPHFSSGRYALDKKTIDRSTPFWEALLRHKADVILNSHDHLYERFAPQTSDGKPSSSGVRQFTVGTGGKVLYKQLLKQFNSERLIDDQFGVLSMRLSPNAYEWNFVGIDGKILDSGHQQCVK